jgi:hypothetical protein
VNSIPQFFVTKRLQLRFKKNAAAAAEPNGLEEAKFKDEENSMTDVKINKIYLIKK